MKKRGFSLTELMISLTIMTVIIMISVPVMINSTSGNNKLLYKSAFNLTERVINELVQDLALSPSGILLNSTFCINFSNKINTVGTVNCTSSTIPDTPNFTTSNGMRWYGLDASTDFTNANCVTAGYSAAEYASSKCKFIYVDVDGVTKGLNSNTTSDIKRDILRIVLFDSGKVSTPNTPATEGEWLETTYLTN